MIGNRQLNRHSYRFPDSVYTHVMIIDSSSETRCFREIFALGNMKKFSQGTVFCKHLLRYTASCPLWRIRIVHTTHTHALNTCSWKNGIVTNAAYKYFRLAARVSLRPTCKHTQSYRNEIIIEDNARFAFHVERRKVVLKFICLQI